MFTARPFALTTPHFSVVPLQCKGMGEHVAPVLHDSFPRVRLERQEPEPLEVSLSEEADESLKNAEVRTGLHALASGGGGCCRLRPAYTQQSGLLAPEQLVYSQVDFP